MSVIGVLVTHAPPTDPIFDYLRAGLRQYGYDDKNIRIEVRTALGRLERVPGLAEELVRLKPAAILVVNEIAIRAVQEATSTIPIVMVGYTANDPMAMGLIDTYARPGGNLTGLFSVDSTLVAKRLEILKEALPEVSPVAVLWDSSFGRHQVDELERAAQRLSLELGAIDVRSPRDLAPAIDAAKRNGAGALILTFSPWFWMHRARIAELALQAKLPAVSEFYQLMEAGGLLSYGSSGPSNWARAAYYVGRLLKGAKLADLPVEQVSAFRLAVNLKTAKALGLVIPQSVLLRADEVIE
jgi:putative ABC transport system substrate-binding protein